MTPPVAETLSSLKPSFSKRARAVLKRANWLPVRTTDAPAGAAAGAAAAADDDDAAAAAPPTPVDATCSVRSQEIRFLKQVKPHDARPYSTELG